MEEKKFKTPKFQKKGLFGDGSEPILWGSIITLVSLIGLLGKGPVGSFLTYLVVYLFGAYYFLVFALLIFFGVYLMVKRKIVKIHITMRLLGAIFVLFSCLIASSAIGTDIYLNNFAREYFSSIKLIRLSSSNFELDLSQVADVGGGFIGYLLCALFNTTVAKQGTMVIYITFMAIGLVLLLKDIVVYLIKWGKGIKERPMRRFEEADRIQRDEKVASQLEKNTINDDYRNPYKTIEFERTKRIKEQEFKDEPVQEVAPEEEIVFNKSTFDDEVIDNSQFQKTSFFVNDLDDSLMAHSRGEKAPLYNKDSKDAPHIKDIISTNVKEKDLDFAPFQEKKEVGTTFEENETEIVNFSTSTFDDEVKEVVRPSSSNMKTPLEESIPSNKTKKDVPLFRKNEENAQEEQRALRPYIYPPIDLLKNRMDDTSNYENIQIANDRLYKINELFESFKIGARVISYTIGPSVTRFNVKMDPGVKVNVLSTIQNEIAIKLGGNKTVRIDLIVEGQETSAIEVGNVKSIPVSYRECISSIMNRVSEKDKLLVPLGKDVSGNIVTVNIDELPHLLVAGTTGSGKSVFINTIITTLIMRNKPDELKLMLIDPKKVEFSKYNGLPHLLCPVITEAVDGKVALQRLVDEMERRYTLFLEKGRGATKLSEYAEIARDKGYEIPPSIVMVCDEFSDFMTDYRKEIEVAVKRLAQKARAAGIYLIICTQRPSVNVITGDIKAVVPSRIGLSVPSVVDSRTMLDEGGAESLLGNGDMLARIPRHNTLVRVQGSYVSTGEIADIIDYIKEQREPEFDPHFLNLSLPKDASMFGSDLDAGRKGKDEMHEQAKEHVMRTKIASTSNLQSKFGIGYARADHILYCLEEEGIVKRVSGNRRIVVKTIDDSEE